jgi:DnaJ-class molecular chaperone
MIQHPEATEHLEGFVCGACNGTGFISRDPDIGTDQECFVCDGKGYFAEEFN